MVVAPAISTKTNTPPASSSSSASPSSDLLAEEGTDNPQQGTPRPLVGEIMVPKAQQVVDTKANNRVPATVKDSRKLFVGGLPQDVTPEEFRAFFEQFGVVADSVVMMDRDTNRSRGFGFVTFEDAAVSQGLLGDSSQTSGTATPSRHLEMRGKMVELKTAEPKAAVPSGRGSRGAGGRGGARGRHNNNKTWQPTPVYPISPAAYYPTTNDYYHQQQQHFTPPPSLPMHPNDRNFYDAAAYGYAVPPPYYYYPQTYGGYYYADSVIRQTSPGIPDKENDNKAEG